MGALWRLPLALRAKWRRSLRFRVIAGTILGSTAVVVLLMPVLLGNVTSGILDAKEASALAEANAARSEAQRLLDATSDQGAETPASRRVDAVVSAMGARGAEAGLFEVLMLSSEPGGLSATPERGTNLVSEASIPAEMRTIVAGNQREAWTYTTIEYTDGTQVPGFVVGSPLAVRGVGPYELYQLFPLTQEQNTLQVVRNATLWASVFIILGLAVLAALVTYWLVTPVHEAARSARRFSSGHLESRMRVRGEDDLAQLAVSFNEMAGVLQTQIRDMEAMSQAQQRFVADVSHELRTPMTTVRMAADLLHDKRQELPADDARAVELLQNQLNRFEALLADLLETSRQDAGTVHLDLEEVDVRRLAEQVIAGLAPLAEQTGSSVHLLGPTGQLVACDQMRVERILANLLSNALEHGEGRPVLVEVSRVDGEVRVAVTDHGVGLNQDELAHVFTRFWRADPARVRRIGGTGLGLSIALGDARAHGGSLTASGAPGEGATFTLCLPAPPLAALPSGVGA